MNEQHAIMERTLAWNLETWRPSLFLTICATLEISPNVLLVSSPVKWGKSMYFRSGPEDQRNRVCKSASSS